MNYQKISPFSCCLSKKSRESCSWKDTGMQNQSGKLQENTEQPGENKESFIDKELPAVSDPAAKPSGNKKIQQGSSTDKTIQKNPSEEETVKINKETAYFNKKFGGTIQPVTKKLWLKSYDNDIFNCDSNTQYFLSYSKKQEVLYGILSIKTNYGTIEIRVCENTMIDSGYRKLRKTKINGINIAICSIGEKGDTDPNYGAIFKKSHTVYTIERNGDLSELIAALKEIISYT